MRMRKPRVLQDGAVYHVTARANRREPILDPSAVKELFLEVVARAKRKYDFRLGNFCVMGNHVHFIIRPGAGECLSSIMRWILGVFAMAYNRLRGLSGHVWGQRFYSRVVSGFFDYVRMYSYLDRNPVAAGLVPNGREWRFGGLWHDRAGCRRVVGAPPEWILLLFPEHESLALPLLPKTRS